MLVFPQKFYIIKYWPIVDISVSMDSSSTLAKIFVVGTDGNRTSSW